MKPSEPAVSSFPAADPSVSAVPVPSAAGSSVPAALFPSAAGSWRMSKMKKLYQARRILAVILAVTMVFGMVPETVHAAAPDNQAAPAALFSPETLFPSVLTCLCGKGLFFCGVKNGKSAKTLDI